MKIWCSFQRRKSTGRLGKHCHTCCLLYFRTVWRNQRPKWHLGLKTYTFIQITYTFFFIIRYIVFSFFMFMNICIKICIYIYLNIYIYTSYNDQTTHGTWRDILGYNDMCVSWSLFWKNLTIWHRDAPLVTSSLIKAVGRNSSKELFIWIHIFQELTPLPINLNAI